MDVEDTAVACLLDLSCVIIYGESFDHHVLAAVVLGAPPFHGQIDACPLAVDASQHFCHFVRLTYRLLVVLQVIERASRLRLLQLLLQAFRKRVNCVGTVILEDTPQVSHSR